jgi:flotillin
MDQAQEMLGNNGLIAGILGIVAFLVLIWILKSLIKVTLPDNLLVVTGRKKVKDSKTYGFSVERGRTMVIPYFQSVDKLALDILPINVKVEGVNSANGITVGADATACVCIDDDSDPMLYSAVERLMGKSQEEIKDQVQQTLIGNFRGALNKATPLEAIGMQESKIISGDEEDQPKEETHEEVTSSEGERAMFRNALLDDINSDISSFGMKVVSVSLQKIWDTTNYIANLAQRTLAQKRQEVQIEEARLQSIAEKSESDAQRRIEVARSRANERILEAREKLEVYRRESDALIDKAKQEADNKIQGAINEGQRQVEELNVALNKLRNDSEILIEEKAKQKRATILSEGELESAKIIEAARNKILKQKVEMLAKSGSIGATVLFIQQQLPNLFKSYKQYAAGFKVDSLVIMDDDKGFNGAVNRGPEAFVNFLSHFEDATGVKIKDFLTSNAKVKEVKS